MILKAGTYRFNGELNFDTIPFEYLEAFEVYSYVQDANYQFTEVIDSFSNEASFQTFSFVKYPIENGYLTIFQYIQSIDLGATSNNVLNAYLSEVGWNGEEYEVPNEKLQTLTIVKDTEVADEFGEWYISSTDYNEVNGSTASPLAEITYNGETIAQLNAGETATLSCEGMKMASDVVVKVNEVESKIPDGYIKPEGTLELVFNNIEAEFPIDCSQYAKVTVNTAEPLKISDPNVLDNITDSPWGVGGSVFLYEGATTDSYEKDALYYLEDTDK